jgi:hypothetical protein
MMGSPAKAGDHNGLGLLRNAGLVWATSHGPLTNEGSFYAS